MTFSERAVETKLAQAICRSDDGPGVPSCVMDAHPERDPCDDKNCRRLAQARAVLAALAMDGLALVPSTISDNDLRKLLGRDSTSPITPMHTMFRDFYERLLTAASDGEVG